MMLNDLVAARIGAASFCGAQFLLSVAKDIAYSLLRAMEKGEGAAAQIFLLCKKSLDWKFQSRLLYFIIMIY
jgi:hypothetical protein